MHTFLYFLTIACYAIFILWRRAPAGFSQAIFLVGVILQAYLIFDRAIYRQFYFDLLDGTIFILWMTLVVYWVSHRLNLLKFGLWRPVQIAILLPSIFLILLQSNVYPNILPNMALPSALSFHLIIAFIAYGILTFASIQASLMMLLNRQLHHQTKLLGQFLNFPSLLEMENILFKAITLGFILLTASILSGLMFSEKIFGQVWQWKHKNIFSVLAWSIYATLLWGRYRYGWRGIKALRLTLLGFVFLLLAYLGVKFVLEVILER